MKYEVNECCGCAVPGYPCLGDSCSLRHTIRYKCEICGYDDLSEEDMYDEDICLRCHSLEEDEDEE